ncbi:MAG: alpha/beta hydrolase [Gemmatimonadales bacterium]
MTTRHEDQPVRSAGAPLPDAKAAVIMIHGRGTTAESILTLESVIDRPDVAYLAPQAAGNTWYPYSFLMPIEQNEPGISSAMATIEQLVASVAAGGIPAERTVLLGFSQGACLAGEFAARHARRYGGVVMLSGGLIGPDGTPRDYAGSLEGTPVFLGCSDVDQHIPADRVRHSAEVLRRLGGNVTMKLYPGMGHLVNEDEIAAIRDVLTGSTGP